MVERVGEGAMFSQKFNPYLSSKEITLGIILFENLQKMSLIS